MQRVRFRKMPRGLRPGCTSGGFSSNEERSCHFVLQARTWPEKYGFLGTSWRKTNPRKVSSSSKAQESEHHSSSILAIVSTLKFVLVETTHCPTTCRASKRSTLTHNKVEIKEIHLALSLSKDNLKNSRGNHLPPCSGK